MAPDPGAELFEKILLSSLEKIVNKVWFKAGFLPSTLASGPQVTCW